MDGFEVAKRIDEDAELGRPRVLMLTSGAVSGELARCRAVGVAAYLLKPVKHSELLETILAVIASPGRAGDEPSETVQPARRGELAE